MNRYEIMKTADFKDIHNCDVLFASVEQKSSGISRSMRICLTKINCNKLNPTTNSWRQCIVSVDYPWFYSSWSLSMTTQI